MSRRPLSTQVLPTAFLEKMSPKDRPKGVAGMLPGECRERWENGEEKGLQSLVANFLNLREIYFETDRMDRKTTGKKGRSDFRICYRGRWLSVECKAEGGSLSPEQVKTLEAVRKSGGVTIVAFGLPAVQEALRSIDREVDSA